MDAERRHGRHDPGARRRAQRKGRETGAWVYIAGDQLRACGLDSEGEVPFYRIWAGQRGRLIVTLYREA